MVGSSYSTGAGRYRNFGGALGGPASQTHQHDHVQTRHHEGERSQAEQGAEHGDGPEHSGTEDHAHHDRQHVPTALARLGTEVRVGPLGPGRGAARGGDGGVRPDQDEAPAADGGMAGAALRGVFGQSGGEPEGRGYQDRPRPPEHAQMLVKLSDGVARPALASASKKARCQHRRPHHDEYQEDHDRQEPLDLPSDVLRPYKNGRHDGWMVGNRP